MPTRLRGARRGCAGAGRSPAAASACISKRGNSCPPARPYPTWRRGSGGIELVPTILLAACRARARRKASEAMRPAVCAMPLPLHGVPPPCGAGFHGGQVGRSGGGGLELSPKLINENYGIRTRFCAHPPEGPAVHLSHFQVDFPYCGIPDCCRVINKQLSSSSKKS